MPDAADGVTDPPLVAHSNPVTQAGFTMIPNVIMLRSDLRPVSKLVYGYLSHLAWRNGNDSASSPLARIAADLNISEDTVRASIQQLEAASCLEGDDRADAPRLLVSKRRGLGLPNLYRISDPELPAAPESRPRIFPSQEIAESADPARDRDSEEEPKTLRAKRETTSLIDFSATEAAQIRDAWLAQPHLIAHRPSYFTEVKPKRQIAAAVKRYGLPDVLTAIHSYAEVVASPAHYYSHRFTLGNFLSRALDDFVPEANPWDNFQSRSTTRSGDARVSIAEIQAQANEALRQEEQDRDHRRIEGARGGALLGLPAAGTEPGDA